MNSIAIQQNYTNARRGTTLHLAKSTTPADVKAALDSLGELDERLTRAEQAAAPFKINDLRILFRDLRGDFSADTVNLLRAEFERLWRMAEVSADVDVIG